jgi:AmmeMemoRadiSam system protein B/AmmeMemoRadiSam system protein A
MKARAIIFISIWFSFLSIHACGQGKQDPENQKDHEPVVAGSFYPAQPSLLKSQLDGYLKSCSTGERKTNIAALVVPHAGYRYSGGVAGTAYCQLDPDHQYDNIFILAPSHHVRFKGVSIYTPGDYVTPLGKVEVNRQLVEKLVRENRLFDYHPQAHRKEHSLEVQLPFLQHHLKKGFKIVPLLTGTQDPEEIRKIAGILEPYFNKDNLFVVSTDFSHFPNYRDAKRVDAITASAVAKNEPAVLLRTLRSNAGKDISRLATSMCGWPGMLTLLNITGNHPDKIEVRKLQYSNSGDVTGDSSRVVGYWSMAFIRKNGVMTNNDHMDFQIKEEEKQTLLEIARKTVNTFVQKGEVPEFDEGDITETLKVHTGAFVTLYQEGELRGCIGRFNPDMPLYEVVRDMAVAASSQDERFPPVGREELDDISIEVSVLTPLRKVSSSDEVEVGRDGIYIKKGPYAGTLLPQVAEKYGWTREEFLGYCAKNKVGIGWEGWKDAEVYTYQAIVIKENDDRQGD